MREKAKELLSKMDKSLSSPEYEDGVLLALVDSKEDATKIAELYGVTLKSVNAGLATFTTDQDIIALMELGQKNGWPTVQPNYYYPLQ